MFRKDPKKRQEQARKVRRAAEVYLAPTELKLLGSFKRVLVDEGDLVGIFIGLRWLTRTSQGRQAHRLPTTFLLAVTNDDKVHFLKYRTRDEEVEIQKELLVLDRDAVGFRVDHGDLYIDVSEYDFTTPIRLESKIQNPWAPDDPGAVEVVDALSE